LNTGSVAWNAVDFPDGAPGINMEAPRIDRARRNRQWFLQKEPEDAGILTLFLFPVRCVLLVMGLLAGRRLGLLLTGGKRVMQR
jgi:hypothetical protein